MLRGCIEIEQIVVEDGAVDGGGFECLRIHDRRVEIGVGGRRVEFRGVDGHRFQSRRIVRRPVVRRRVRRILNPRVGPRVEGPGLEHHRIDAQAIDAQVEVGLFKGLGVDRQTLSRLVGRRALGEFARSGCDGGGGFGFRDGHRSRRRGDFVRHWRGFGRRFAVGGIQWVAVSFGFRRQRRLRSVRRKTPA
jgi:hypothetical protein